MFLSMLKGKIHGATVTEADVYYEGSIGIDQSLLTLSGILPNERVSVWNRSNGKRFDTYAIVEPAGSGKISVNGAAALLVSPGDTVIIAAFALMTEEEAKNYQPNIVLISEKNSGTLK